VYFQKLNCFFTTILTLANWTTTSIVELSQTTKAYLASHNFQRVRFSALAVFEQTMQWSKSAEQFQNVLDKDGELTDKDGELTDSVLKYLKGRTGEVLILKLQSKDPYTTKQAQWIFLVLLLYGLNLMFIPLLSHPN